MSAVFWLLLAVAGRIAVLQLIEAGPFPRYQHYAPLSQAIRTDPWAVVVLSLQTLIVSVAVGLRIVAAARTGTVVRARALRIFAAIFCSAATAAVVSPDVRRYAAEVALAGGLQVISMATVWLFAVSLGKPLPRVAAWLGAEANDRARRTDPVPIVCAIAATAMAATLSIAAYERHPHLPDEVGYLYHAKYFAEGMITMPAAPVPAAFDADLMTYEADHWYSPVPPGWPAMLTIGVWAGVPWLINPLICGLNVLLTYRFARLLYSTGIARAAAALMASSPWFLFLAMNFMTHQFTLLCVLTAAISLEQARRTGKSSWGFLAGIAVAMTTLIRPLEGIITGALLGFWAIGLGGTRLRLRPMTAFVIGAVLLGSLQLPYNKHLTGDALNFPLNHYFDKYYHPGANALGFGPDRGVGWAIDPNPGHSPIDGLININLNVASLNADLFGWGTGSLILIAWLVFAGHMTRHDRMLLVAVVSLVGAYFFYYFSGGPDFGARYWFPIVISLVFLSARGIESLERVLPAVRIAIAAMILISLTVYIPWRATDKYWHYRGMRADVRALGAAHGFNESDLVLVRGQRFPDYASAIVYNPVDLRSRHAVYAWDKDAETRKAVLNAYPNRTVWILEGPTVTGGAFRVKQGPIPPSARSTIEP